VNEMQWRCDKCGCSLEVGGVRCMTCTNNRLMLWNGTKLVNVAHDMDANTSEKAQHKSDRKDYIEVTVRVPIIRRPCAYCGKEMVVTPKRMDGVSFKGRQRNAMFCSASCKVQEFRRRCDKSPTKVHRWLRVDGVVLCVDCSTRRRRA
jgi:hypothetical protein